MVGGRSAPHLLRFQRPPISSRVLPPHPEIPMRAAHLCVMAIIPLASACTPSRRAEAPLSRISSISFLPDLPSASATTSQVLYQDGAIPTRIPGGTLWTFGDTFTGTRGQDNKPAYTGCLSNTMAFLPQGATTWPPPLQYLTGVKGLAKPPLSPVEGEVDTKRRLWPLAGICLDSPSRAYMFYGLIDITGPGPWGFKPVGTGLARAEQPFRPYERLNNGQGGWPIDPTSILQHEGFLYLYAPRRFEGEQSLTSGVPIARVRPANIQNPTRSASFPAP